MTKTECLKAQKKFQDLSIEAVKMLKTLPPATIQAEISVLPQKLTDRLFLQTGIEQQMLDFNVGKLNLETDEDYKKMLSDYNDQMEALNK